MSNDNNTERDEDFVNSGEPLTDSLEYSSGPESIDGSEFDTNELIECKIANLFQAQANTIQAEANTIQGETISRMKRLNHNLFIRRKRARFYFAKKKIELQRLRMLQHHERKEKHYFDSIRKEERASLASVNKRQREYDNTVDTRRHEKRIQLIDEQHSHCDVVRECAFELTNRKRLLDLEYNAIIAQQRMDLVYQQNEIQMCVLEKRKKIAELKVELCTKYGAKQSNKMFDVDVCYP